MRPKVVLTVATLLLVAGIVVQVRAQAPAGGRGAAPAQGGRGGGGRGSAQSFPAQQRELADPAVVARGATLYEIYCRSCHGADLRGGDIGGPNLLRSSVVLEDQAGELIEPIVLAGRANPGMPVMAPLPLPSEDIRAIAEYIHSVLATAGRQGAPPPGEEVELDILVGDAEAGRAYFEAQCSSCHSATGDLQGIATRIVEPKAMQNTWVAGRAGGGGRGGGGGGGPEAMVTVTPPGGTPVTGRIDHLDDFLVVLTTTDGQRHSFARRGGVPEVVVDDPLARHIELMSIYSDTDMHNVTAYLVTLK